jgi:cytochrome P450
VVFFYLRTRCSQIHALRRRQLAHGFSQVSIQNLEYILDGQLNILLDKIRHYAKAGEDFDLKDSIARYILYILGDVAFSRSFDTQTTRSLEALNAINGHLNLACVIGQLPNQNIAKTIVAWSRVGWIKRLTKSRANLKAICANHVARRISKPSGRKDLLQSLIDAKDPDTGAKLTELDINRGICNAVRSNTNFSVTGHAEPVVLAWRALIPFL